MNNFLTFLGEAWPPPQKKPGTPEGDQKSPFGNSAGPKKPKPSFGDQGTPSKPSPAKKPPFGPKSPSSDDGAADPSFGQPGQDEGAGPNGAMSANPEVALMMQQAEQEKAEQEAAIAQQKAEQEAIERQKVKNLRAQADTDVMDALGDKYNDDTDVVEFYPDMLTFTQYNSELDKQKADGKKKQGVTPSGQDTSTTVASGGSGAAVGAQTSSEIETGDKGETPKVPDAAKSKSDLKKKKIRGAESDDSESLGQPPTSEIDGDEDEELDDVDETGEDEEIDDETGEEETGDEDETGEETGDEEVPPLDELRPQDKPNNQGMGSGERKIFKIKPVDHIKGDAYVGEDDVDAKMEDQFGEDEDGEDSGFPFGKGKPPFGKSKDKGEGKSPFGKDKSENKSPFGKDIDEDEDEAVPKVKKFSEFGGKKKKMEI